jgi:hypothetical protein
VESAGDGRVELFECEPDEVMLVGLERMKNYEYTISQDTRLFRYLFSVALTFSRSSKIEFM